MRRLGAVERVPDPAGLAVDLEHVEVRPRELEGALDALLPFLARAVAAEDDAPRPPRVLVEPADLDDEVPLLLGREDEVAPVAERAAGGLGAVEDGAGGSGAGSITQVGGMSARRSFRDRAGSASSQNSWSRWWWKSAKASFSSWNVLIGGVMATSPDAQASMMNPAVLMLARSNSSKKR